MTPSLHSFADIHTHDLTAAGRPDSVVNLTPSDTLPAAGNFSVGIHPWDTNAGEPTLTSLKALVRMARDPRTVAVGEAGFDRMRGGDIELQRRVFDFHARLAERVGKPLIIHAVKADDLLAAAIRRHRPSVEWIIHGFRGNATRARQLLRMGFSLSLGHRFNPEAEAVIPPDRLYHESDAPARSCPKKGFQS